MKKKYFGYKIIQTLPIGNITFYIGYKKNDRQPYATYFRRNSSKEFAWVRFLMICSLRKRTLLTVHTEKYRF